MSDIIQAHLDSLEATFRIGLAQVDALRHALVQPPTKTEMPSARVSLPERCEGIERCALKDDDHRIEKSTFAGRSWKCKGCGHQETSAA